MLSSIKTHNNSAGLMRSLSTEKEPHIGPKLSLKVSFSFCHVNFFIALFQLLALTNQIHVASSKLKGGAHSRNRIVGRLVATAEQLVDRLEDRS